MRASSKLGVREAARIIYATQSPSEAELSRVRERLQSGALRGDRGRGAGCWTTTVDDVAAYLAARQCARRTGSAGGRRAGIDGVWSDAYRSILRDYFRAVVLRRRVNRGGPWFRRAVTATQWMVLALAVALGAKCIGMAMRPDLSPEQRLVKAWLDAHAREYRIDGWQGVERSSNSVGVRLAYHYRSAGGKMIRTERVFRVADNRIVSVDSF